MPDAPAIAKQFFGIAPYFLVRDVVKAAEYYRDALGFNYSQFWGEPPCFCMPRRDGITIMLSQTQDASIIRPNAKARHDESWDAYVWVKDADALYAEVKPRGAIIAYEPVLQDEYGNREFAVRDLDGYLIAFGSDAT
jgi:catechol 2,3-dioxygenase-like lactoylglutathione lyase family enzyme